MDYEVFYLLAICMLPLLYILACEYEERRRSAAWRRQAVAADLAFLDRDRAFVPGCGFPFFRLGALHEVRNVLSGERNGFSFKVAEYTYRRRLSPAFFSSHATFRQTICLLEADGLLLPQLALLSPAFKDRLGYEPFWPECPLADDPPFNAAYNPQGKDAQAIHAILTLPARQTLMRQRDWRLSIHGESRHLLLHNESPIQPGQIDPFIEACLAVAAVFRQRRAEPAT